MLKASKGITRIKGDRDLILAEFSTLVLALREANFSEKDITMAFTNAILVDFRKLKINNSPIEAHKSAEKIMVMPTKLKLEKIMEIVASEEN